MNYLFAFLLILNSPLLLIAADDIVVALETDSALTPLYLAPIIQENTPFDNKYVQQLEKIFAFDLTHNGSTYLVKQADSGDLPGKAFDDFGAAEDWQKQNIFYVVKARIKEKNISLCLLDVAAKSLKSSAEFPLTGNLNEDRR